MQNIKFTIIFSICSFFGFIVKDYQNYLKAKMADPSVKFDWRLSALSALEGVLKGGPFGAVGDVLSGAA